ncbi:MAG: DUF2807 domain-containing protein, partial [Bacteroidales bacterium]|nr:DUF2807 domain-containing protein [Bacteroidales bacterium]
MKRLSLLIASMSLVMMLFAQTTKKEFNVSGYESLSAGGVFSIELIKSSKEGVTIETENKDIMEYIKVSVSNNTLHLSMNWKDMPSSIQKKMKPVKAVVYINELKSINLSGALRLNSTSIFNPAQFDAKISGAVNINGLEINTESAKINISGASSLVLKGKMGKITYIISGASKLTLDQEIGSLIVDGSGAAKIDFTGSFNTALLSFAGAVNSKIRGKGADEVLLEVSGASNFNAVDFPVKDM